MLIIYLVTILVNTGILWKLKQGSMISCLWQVICVLLCCVLDLQVTSMLTPSLVTTFALLSLLSTMLVHTTNFCAT